MKARLYYFLAVSFLVLNLGPQLPEKGAYALAYFGAVLAALLLLGDESKLPHKGIILCCAYVAACLWAVWKLLSDPNWVTYRRTSFVVLTRRSLLRSIRGLDSREEVLNKAGVVELTRLLTLTETTREETCAFLKAARAAGYWKRLAIAIRILRSSSRVLPAAEMAQQITFGRRMQSGPLFPFPGMVMRVGEKQPDESHPDA